MGSFNVGKYISNYISLKNEFGRNKYFKDLLRVPTYHQL